MNTQFVPPPERDIAEAPWMPEKSASLLRSLLKDSDHFLEYGAGGSTRLAATMPLQTLTSVESDRAFLQSVDYHIQKDAPRIDWRPIFVNIGPTALLGYPKTLKETDRWARYALTPWSQNTDPDLILIDGRFRVACALAAARHATPGTRVFVDDYGLRPWYWNIEDYLKPVTKAGRARLFEVAEHPPESLKLALKRAIRDPR